MLVSSIARFNALNSMNSAAMSFMQASDSMMNAAANAHPFGGEHDLSMLNKMDNKLNMDLSTNRLLYKVAYLQEKMAAKQQKQAAKQSLNYLA